MSERAEVKKLGAWIEERTNGVVGLTTWSPGDGVTRYRLGDNRNSIDVWHDYFGDNALVTAFGVRQAHVMCRAFLEGMDALSNPRR